MKRVEIPCRSKLAGRGRLSLAPQFSCFLVSARFKSVKRCATVNLPKDLIASQLSQVLQQKIYSNYRTVQGHFLQRDTFDRGSVPNSGRKGASSAEYSFSDWSSTSPVGQFNNWTLYQNVCDDIFSPLTVSTWKAGVASSTKRPRNGSKSRLTGHRRAICSSVVSLVPSKFGT